MRKLKVKPEWGSTPIRLIYADDPWFDESSGCYYYKPEELPLSVKLIKEIWDWASIYDTFLDWDDPATPKYIDPKVEADFWKQGEAIAKKLQDELGNEYQVSYQHPGAPDL